MLIEEEHVLAVCLLYHREPLVMGMRYNSFRMREQGHIWHSGSVR